MCAHKHVCSSYAVLLETLKVLQEDKRFRGDTRAKIIGLHEQAMKARTYFRLVSCEGLFELCEVVAKMLQHRKASAGVPWSVLMY